MNHVAITAVEQGFDLAIMFFEQIFKCPRTRSISWDEGASQFVELPYGSPIQITKLYDFVYRENNGFFPGVHVALNVDSIEKTKKKIEEWGREHGVIYTFEEAGPGKEFVRLHNVLHVAIELVEH